MHTKPQQVQTLTICRGSQASRLQGSFWAQGSDSDDAEPSSEEESTESSDGSSSSSESETAARKGASRRVMLQLLQYQLQSTTLSWVPADSWPAAVTLTLMTPAVW